MKTCKCVNCIANFDGECVVDKCRGEINAIDLPELSRSQAAWHYHMAAEIFEDTAKMVKGDNIDRGDLANETPM